MENTKTIPEAIEVKLTLSAEEYRIVSKTAEILQCEIQPLIMAGGLSYGFEGYVFEDAIDEVLYYAGEAGLCRFESFADAMALATRIKAALPSKAVAVAPFSGGYWVGLHVPGGMVINGQFGPLPEFSETL